MHCADHKKAMEPVVERRPITSSTNPAQGHQGKEYGLIRAYQKETVFVARPSKTSERLGEVEWPGVGGTDSCRNFGRVLGDDKKLESRF